MGTQSAANLSCALVRPISRIAMPMRRAIAHTGVRRGHAATHSHSYPYSVEPRITHIDRAIIRAYFRHLHGRPTAAQLRQDLQPLLRGRRSANSQTNLPPTTTPLPEELEQKLSALAAGFQRVRAGSDVLLIETTTRTVIDVLPDINTTV